ncbi:MAG: glycosyltransferase [Blautia sp.]|uniref:glycosyltransferase family 2 protein n=1 Tax=Blautia sp. TaxID=1955243 RepID=UPI0025856D2B|nr:glycosyltransferase family 2 protein [Blautia sp.]MCI7289265.1 glycosyltransferase [Blautia sp.]
MKEIKISIIIPTYNMSCYIERCLKSVMNQTWKNLEVIVVDDGSTDDTVNVVKLYAAKDKRIQIVEKKNGGVTSARLVGVTVATGELIGFVDGDDIIEVDMYEHLLSNAIEYSADISHCGYQMVFPNRVDYYYNTGRLVIQDKNKGLKDLIKGAYIEPGLCNKLFRRKLFDRILSDNLMDISIKNNEDLMMNFYLFSEAENSIYEDFCPYHYIVRKNSAANGRINENRLLDPIKVTRHLLRETISSDELYRILKERYVRQIILLASMDVQENPELIKRNQNIARQELRGLIHEIMFNNSYGIKLKVMAILASWCPGLYRCIHGIYEQVTGLNKIYEIE